MAPLDRVTQTKVLSERYAVCVSNDLGTTLMLLIQAPAIGWMCTVVWSSVRQDTPSLYFVLTLSAVWFGCINACREIVKERNILERERFFGLSLLSYVLSKVWVLGVLSLLQVFLMQIAVEWHMGLKGPFLIQTMALWGASLCGVGLGLLVSAISSRQERAVAAVPLLLLPQILFSQFVLPKEALSDTVRFVEKLMPVHWGFEVFSELAKAEPDWLYALGAVLVAFAYALLLFLVTVPALMNRQEI